MAERKRMTTRFKELFEQKQFFVMAGGMNPIGARMAEALGYEVFYMSGGNTSAHQLGWPDSGSSMRDMVDNARKIVLTVDIPVFSDADTGYGDAVNTYRTVQEYMFFVMAGGMNPIGARMAEALGYEVFYMSGGNTSAHQLGWPDSGSSMRDMVDNARKIVLTVNIPVFSDADTGYGDAVNTYRTVREYIQAGIAGCHIEDQTFPPKSGPRRRCISITGNGRQAQGGDGRQDGTRPGLCHHGPV